MYILQAVIPLLGPYFDYFVMFLCPTRIIWIHHWEIGLRATLRGSLPFWARSLLLDILHHLPYVVWNTAITAACFILFFVP